MKQRVVFDTTTVLSALLFKNGRLAWLREHWQEERYIPLLSRTTALELTRVLAYPRFRLEAEQREELLAEYLLYCEAVEVTQTCPVFCRDMKTSHFSI